MFVKYFRCIIIFHTFSYLTRYKHIIFIKFIICYNCKADKKTGTPVIISTYIGGNMVETKKVKKWTMNLFDKEGKPIRFEIEFNNAVGNGKRSGATTMFKIFK